MLSSKKFCDKLEVTLTLDRYLVDGMGGKVSVVRK